MGEFLTVLAGFFQFYADVKAFIQFRQQYTEEQWENEGQQLTDAISAAKDDAQRADLVRRLSAHQLDTP